MIEIINENNSIILLYSRNFERMLIQSGKDLNVCVNFMDPVQNLGIPKYGRIETIEREVKVFLNSTKSLTPPMELVVVVIPDYPPGIYGK